MAKDITYQELTQIILQLSQKQYSGTLFLRNDDHQSGLIFFGAGTIIGTTFSTARGHAAIAALRAYKGNFTCRFEEGKPMPVRQDLSSPEETLREFGLEVGSPPVTPTSRDSSATQPPANKPPPSTPPKATTSAQPAAAKPLNGNAPQTGGSQPELLARIFLPDRLVRQIVTEEMTKHLGPVAFALVDDAESAAGGLGTYDQVQGVLRQLAAELADTGEQEEFEHNVRQRIERLFTKEACTLITGELVELIGPLARDVCERALKQQGGRISSPSELEQLVTLLLREIPDKKDARSFQLKIDVGLTQLSLGHDNA